MINSQEHARRVFIGALVRGDFGRVTRLTQASQPMLHVHSLTGEFLAAYPDNGTMDDVLQCIQGRWPVN